MGARQRLGLQLGTVEGAIINVLSFRHPHIRSLEKEGLWGFPRGQQNERRWHALQIGIPILVYGEYQGKRGVWLRGVLVDKTENLRPVPYWTQNPSGYPFQIRVKVEVSSAGSSTPITKEELASSFSLPLARQKLDRWSLVVFGEQRPGVTYGASLFARINDEFTARNAKPIVIPHPTHDNLKEMIYQMGAIQAKFPLKEFTLEDGRRLDVVWRRTLRSVPNWAFEVQIGGNLVEALAKLKHVWDLYSSIPVLVTRPEQVPEAQNLLTGSFHEIKDVMRLLTDAKLSEFYQAKLRFRDVMVALGVS